MMALTVRQPWAWAIFHGKDVENRSNWRYKHTGPTAIHAGLHLAPAAAFERVAELSPHTLGQLGAPHCPTDHELGGVIGLVDMGEAHWWEDCSKTGVLCSPWAERDQWHLPLSGQRLLPRLLGCAGALGIWELPGAVNRELRLVVF